MYLYLIQARQKYYAAKICPDYWSNDYFYACYDFKGIECWSARELQIIFNYTEWRNFLKVIDKGKEACRNSENMVSDHFVEINKMIELAKGAHREIEDMALTRYACYLIAQNG